VVASEKPQGSTPAWRSLGSIAFVAASLLVLGVLWRADLGGGDRRPNVLLVTVDTLRADHLGVYGFSHATSPNLDALASDSVVFERAIAAAAMTAPAHASIFTSRYTRGHSVGYLNGRTRLQGRVTLAERFEQAGYATAAFVSNMVLRKRSGFQRGFEVYDDALEAPERNRSGVYERTAEATTARALSWLEAHGDAPFLLWVHYQDPHGPYTPPDAFAGRIVLDPRPREQPLPVLSNDSGYRGIPAYQALEGRSLPSEYRGLYSDEILHTDHWLGQLVARFDAKSEGRHTIVLVTSDHGENLGEHDFWFVHAFSSMPELAHVPFVLRATGLPAGRRREVVSHVDVMPTLLELAALEPEADSDGVALGPYLRSGAPIPARRVYCDIGRELSAYGSDDFVRVTKLAGAWPEELGEAEGPPVWERFRWSEEGVISRADDRVIVKGPIEAYFGAATPMARNPEELDARDLEALRALGYVDTEP